MYHADLKASTDPRGPSPDVIHQLKKVVRRDHCTSKKLLGETTAPLHLEEVESYVLWTGLWPWTRKTKSFRPPAQTGTGRPTYMSARRHVMDLAQLHWCAVILAHTSNASILHHCICLDMHDHGVQLVDGVQFFPGSICVSGFATPVVNCGTARVPMGLPM